MLLPWVHHIVGNLALELHQLWNLADFSTPKPDVGFHIGQEPHLLGQLGVLEGLVQLWHRQGRESRTFLHGRPGNLISWFMNFFAVFCESLLGGSMRLM